LIVRWLIWRSGNGVRHINEVMLHQARLVLGLDDLWPIYHPGIYPGHSGPLSLAISPWVGAMNTFIHPEGRTDNKTEKNTKIQIKYVKKYNAMQ